LLKEYYFHLAYLAKYFLHLSKNIWIEPGKISIRKNYHAMHMKRAQQLSLELPYYCLPLSFHTLFFNEARWNDAHNRMRASALTSFQLEFHDGERRIVLPKIPRQPGKIVKLLPTTRAAAMAKVRTEEANKDEPHSPMFFRRIVQ